MEPIRILVDADACPVKEEIYRVAARHRVHVSVVSNSPFRVPVGPLVERVVVTADILLADRCLKAGATVLNPNGRTFTRASIGSAVATRAIMADLRSGLGEGIGGPAPFAKADRSRFLQALDEALVRLGRGR